MKVVEMYIKVYCLADVKKEQVAIELNKLMDTCIMKNEAMQAIHRSRDYKFYCFGGLKPIEVSGVYKAGNIYTFMLRTVDKQLADHFNKNLGQQYTKVLKALTVESKEVARRPIEKIYTLTPIIMKFDTGYWRSKYSEEVFEKRLKENIIKKFNVLNGEKIDEDFELFNGIQFDNHKPVAFNYKNVRLLGDKVTLEVAGNERAQQIAYMAIGSGIGEMNSRGAGFVGFKYL